MWVQNLTVCNYLAGSGNAGNEIWWNGGDGSGQVGGFGFSGSYLTATSTFFNGNDTAAQVRDLLQQLERRQLGSDAMPATSTTPACTSGLASRFATRPSTTTTASSACSGYSGSNSGGKVVIKNSEFDNNQDGFDTNSQNGDNPPPQNGACPNNGISPITHTHSCWVFMHNYVHDNNNPNVPAAGTAAQGPVGTGMSVSGGRNDTVMHNRFVHNGAWGTIFVPYPDSSSSPCTGGTPNYLLGPGTCWYEEYGDALLNNTYSGNGFFGNPTNGDFAAFNLEAGPTDCYSGNVEKGGGAAKSSPSTLEQTYPTCNGQTVPPDTNGQFFAEVGCDSQVKIGGTSLCGPNDHYPRQTQVVMHPLPKHLKTMRNPCKGVPRNPWCPNNKK